MIGFLALLAATASATSDLGASPAPTPARSPVATASVRPTPILTGAEHRVPFTRRTSILAVAQKHAASPYTIRKLNGLDRRRPKRVRSLVVSTRSIAPRPFDDGIVINIPAFRLFLLRQGAVVGSWPVALGRDFDRAMQNKTRWRTPIGTFKVRAKYWHPDWLVPKDLQEELETPRQVVPYGDPEYPLGEAKIQLTATGLTIHGTNAPHSIGRLASHGCIRMWNTAVTRLYRQIRPGTPVALVYAPVQVVEDGGRVWLEASRDVYFLAGDLQERARVVLAGANLIGRVDPQLVKSAIQSLAGVATDVTRQSTEPELPAEAITARSAPISSLPATE